MGAPGKIIERREASTAIRVSFQSAESRRTASLRRRRRVRRRRDRRRRDRRRRCAVPRLLSASLARALGQSSGLTSYHLRQPERAIRFGIGIGIGSGLFAQADYDPTRSWERVHQPVLALWGTLDREAMPAESSQVIRQALDRGGNAHHTVRFLPGVRHNLNRTFDEGFDRPDSLPADYAESEAAWIESLADGPPPSDADRPPSQDRLSRPVDGPFAWYESPRWQLAAFAIFLTASLGYPSAAIVRRLRGRRGAPPAARPARWLVIAVTATALGFLGYFCVLILTGAYVIGPVVLGRPMP